jgi:membrane protease YdiL (CAAX protease family)
MVKEATMADFKAFVNRHSVLAYYLVAFAISWVGVLVVIGGPGRIPGTPAETTKLFPAVYLATVAGPCLAGLLLTGLVGGWAGFRELLSRLLRWRVGARWYAAALLTAPLSVIAILLALSLLSPEYLPGFLTTSSKASLGGVLALGFGGVAGLSIFNGFVEELGWTGFAIPRLKLRYGVFTTGFVVGFLWGAWHFVSNVWGSVDSGPLPLAVFMAALLFTFLPPYRVLMVWVYDRTGSLLVAWLMHASLDFFWLISTPAGLTAVPLVTWYLAWATLLWVIVAAVTLAERRHKVPGRIVSRASGARPSQQPA